MNNAKTQNPSVKQQQNGTHANFAVLGLAVLAVAIATLLDYPVQTQAWFAWVIAIMTGSCVGYASHAHCRVRSITQASEKVRDAYPTLLGHINPKNNAWALACLCLLLWGSFSGAAHAGINQWTPIGPEGGPIFTLAIDPSNPATLYAGDFFGDRGVFKSANSGASWQAINTGLTDLRVRAIAIDPLNPTTIYAGTHDDGLFKSINSGASWQAVNIGLTVLRVTAIAIDPLNPAALYAGISSTGVYKSANGGVSWQAVNTGLTGSPERQTAVAIDPLNPAILYAGTLGGGVFKSNNGGASWQAVNTGLTGDLNVYTVAIDPLNPAALYAGISSTGVYKSTNAGASWQAANTANANTLAIDPLNPATLYAGTLGGGVFKSTNGGDSWQAANTGLTDLSVHALAIDPNNPATVYAGTDVGVFKITFSEGNPNLDTDGDGIPDVFEIAHGLNPNDPNDAQLDKDGDGLTNWQEFVLGTNPLDPSTQSGFLSVTPTAPLDFGAVTVGQSSAIMDFTVQNTGNAMLNGSCTTALPFSVAFGPCAYDLAPSVFTDVALEFSPTAEGTFNGTVGFSSNGGNASRSVTGTGTLSPPPQGVIAVTSNSLDFGNILLTANSLTQSVTVTNTGTANLKLGVLSKTGANPDDFLMPGNTCDNATLETNPPNNTCSFSTSFGPSVIGTRTAEVSIPSNDATVSQGKVYLEGGGYDEYQFYNKENQPLWITDQYEIFDKVFKFEGSQFSKFLAVSQIKYGTEGNCFGMALSSIKAAKGLPPYNPSVHRLTEPNKTLDWVLDGVKPKQVEKWDTPQTPIGEINPVLTYIIENHISQFAKEASNEYNVFETLSGKRDVDITNFILNIKGEFNGKTEGHALLPYRIKTINLNQKYIVYVYDSNRLAIGGIQGNIDKRYVTFEKEKDTNIWKWEFVLWPDAKIEGGLQFWRGRQDDSPKTIFLTNVADYDNSSGKRLTLPDTVSVQGVNSSIILSDSGLQTGYTSTTEYNEIPDISLFTPAGAVVNNEEKNTEAWFRGNLNQNLRLQTVPSLGNEVRILKWTPDSQVETKIHGDADGTELFIGKNNDTVTISSITGIYELVLNNDRGGVEHSINISGKSDNPASKYTYSLDWDQVVSGNVQFVVSVDSNGDGTVDYSSTHSGTTLSDNQAPITTPVVTGTNGLNGWYTSDVTVSLSASDGSGVGVKATSYSLDNGPWQMYGSASPVVIMTEGAHTLQYYSTDFFGNQEATKALTVQIDKTAPEASISVDPSTKDLKVAGVDNLGSAAIMKDAVGNYVVTDDAGHTTKLFFTKTYSGKLLTFAQLTGIQYDNASAVTLPKTSFLYVWNPKTTPPLLLSQTIAVNDTFVIQAVYDIKTNKTTVLVLKKGVPIQKLSYSGLRIVQVTTKKGVIGYQL